MLPLFIRVKPLKEDFYIAEIREKISPTQIKRLERGTNFFLILKG